MISKNASTRWCRVLKIIIIVNDFNFIFFCEWFQYSHPYILSEMLILPSYKLKPFINFSLFSYKC
jgi:hypothetical protein